MRKRVVSIRLSDQEYADLKLLADLAGVPISVMARRRALPAPVLPGSYTTSLAGDVTVTWKAA